MWIAVGKVEFHRKLPSQPLVNKMLGSLGRFMQLRIFDGKVSSEIAFPESVRADDALGNLATG